MKDQYEGTLKGVRFPPTVPRDGMDVRTFIFRLTVGESSSAVQAAALALRAAHFEGCTFELNPIGEKDLAALEMLTQRGRFAAQEMSAFRAALTICLDRLSVASIDDQPVGLWRGQFLRR